MLSLAETGRDEQLLALGGREEEILTLEGDNLVIDAANAGDDDVEV